MEDIWTLLLNASPTFQVNALRELFHMKMTEEKALAFIRTRIEENDIGHNQFVSLLEYLFQKKVINAKEYQDILGHKE